MSFNDKNCLQDDLACQALGAEPTLDITKQSIPQLSLVRADTLFARLLGLLGRRTLPPTYALWLKPCSGVHTFGMQCSIGVFF